MSKVDSFVNGWYRHRSVLLELMNVLPDDQMDFRPWEDALSLSGLAVHMVTSAQMFVDAVQTGVINRPMGSPSLQTMDEVRAFILEMTEKTKTDLLALTDEQFETIVDGTQLFGFNAPGKVFLHSMKDHEIHHKGQLFVYARMVGVEKLPFFVSRN